MLQVDMEKPLGPPPLWLQKYDCFHSSCMSCCLIIIQCLSSYFHQEEKLLRVQVVLCNPVDFAKKSISLKDSLNQIRDKFFVILQLAFKLYRDFQPFSLDFVSNILLFPRLSSSFFFLPVSWLLLKIHSCNSILLLRSELGPLKNPFTILFCLLLITQGLCFGH